MVLLLGIGGAVSKATLSRNPVGGGPPLPIKWTVPPNQYRCLLRPDNTQSIVTGASPIRRHNPHARGSWLVAQPHSTRRASVRSRLNTTTFEDIDGETRQSVLVECHTLEVRDAIIKSGMEGGMQEAYDKLSRWRVARVGAIGSQKDRRHGETSPGPPHGVTRSGFALRGELDLVGGARWSRRLSGSSSGLMGDLGHQRRWLWTRVGSPRRTRPTQPS